MLIVMFWIAYCIEAYKAPGGMEWDQFGGMAKPGKFGYERRQ